VKRFSFSLQSVQDHRAIKREAAERELAEAAAAVSIVMAMLQEITNERDKAIEAYVALLESGNADPDEIALRASHIETLALRESRERERIRMLENARDAKRQAAIAASRDEKAISNLRERHRVRHETEVARIEQIALDEMANMAFVRRAE
jgi:flagellar export protein FliJ